MTSLNKKKLSFVLKINILKNLIPLPDGNLPMEGIRNGDYQINIGSVLQNGIFVPKCKPFYRCPDSSEERKVRATQSISLPNGKRFGNEYPNHGKYRRKHTADGLRAQVRLKT